MTRLAYESTSVAADSSQASIRKILRNHGALRFVFGESMDVARVRWAGVEFVVDDHLVRIRVPMKAPDNKWLQGKMRRARSRTRDDFVEEHYDQEEKRIWRVMYWSIKARMEAVDEGVETFTQAFLAHLVDPASNLTLWERIKPSVDAGVLQVGGRGLLGLPSGRTEEVEVL